MDLETNQENEKVLDEWEEELERQLLILQECQSQKELDSCMKCAEILECEVRLNYVNAVYESMNKGTGGGFEF